MSANNEPLIPADDDGISAEQVRDYLKRHRDFLERYPELLDDLHVTHASGSAVSLVEKQVSVLRERNVDMRQRLTALTDNARHNDHLYEQTRHLVLALLEADNLAAMNMAFQRSMQEDFDVEHASLILFGEGRGEDDVRLETPERARIEIGGLLRSRTPPCGALRREELRFLFPKAGTVGSAAVAPLGDQGVIAVGSSDANRYHSGMGTQFLQHIADVIERLLPRLARRD